MDNSIHSGIDLKKKQIESKSRAILPKVWSCKQQHWQQGQPVRKADSRAPDLLTQNLHFSKIPNKSAKCCYRKSPGKQIKNTESQAC